VKHASSLPRDGREPKRPLGGASIRRFARRHQAVQQPSLWWQAEDTGRSAPGEAVLAGEQRRGTGPHGPGISEGCRTTAARPGPPGMPIAAGEAPRAPEHERPRLWGHPDGVERYEL